MRQLKTFMRNRKKEMLACGPCECRTLQCWRYANENCGCGESKTSLPNYVRVEAGYGGRYEIRFFNDDEEQDNEISLEIDTDTEVGGYRTVVGMFGIIEDEEAKALWLNMRESLDVEAVMTLFSTDKGKIGVGHFIPEAMAQFNAFINNPTEEQAETLRDWLEYKASDEQQSPIIAFDEELGLPNYVSVEGDATYGGGIQFFNEDDEQGNSITIEIDTETGDAMISMGYFGIIEDENARALWINIWEDFDPVTIAKLFGMDEGKGGTGRFVPEAMARFNAFIDDPTEDLAGGLKGWLESRASDGQLIVVFDE